MTRFRSLALLPAIVALFLVLSLRPASARAGGDYDPQSTDWNGLSELVRIAQASDVDLRTSDTLDWSKIGRGDGLLILYPLSSVELSDLNGFLDDGGRLALLDDFGDAGPLLQWFQVSRSERVSGTPRSDRVPGLLIAYRRAEHALADGVDTLVTNNPTVLTHPKLSPVFALSEDLRQGVVLAGQVNRGRLVIGSDPSVLINTMMRFGGNRQFAHNLLVFLASHPGGRVHLVHGHFTQSGAYRGRHGAPNSARGLMQSVNDALARLGTLGGDAVVVRILATLLAALATFVLGFKIWGPRPSDRFGPTGPSGAAAGVSEKVAIFSLPRANMLYPTLVAKRYFERVLLRAIGLRPPTDVGAVIARVGNRLDAAQQDSLRTLLVDLDQLSTPSHEGGPARITARRFLSLWQRINAILSALGDKPR